MEDSSMTLSDRVARLEERSEAIWSLLGEMITTMTMPSNKALLAALENPVVNNLLEQCGHWLKHYQELAEQEPTADEKSAVKKAKLDSPIPASLDTPAFHAAWKLWAEDRANRRKKITPHAADLQLRKLAAVGVTRAIEVIELAIEKGWTGLVFDQPGALNGSGQRGPVRSDSRIQFDATRNGQKPVIVCGAEAPAAPVPVLPAE
jgi:hypothetical protein